MTEPERALIMERTVSHLELLVYDPRDEVWELNGVGGLADGDELADRGRKIVESNNERTNHQDWKWEIRLSRLWRS